MNVLTFTTLYPNAVSPGHGIFVETRLRELLARHPVAAQVVAPVPWFPLRSARFGRYAGYARVPGREVRDGIVVHHPRYPVIPKVGMQLAPRLLAARGLRAVREVVDSGFDVDLVDAHYFYPDGVAAAAIARALGKPLIVTARGSDINLIATFEGPRRRILDAAAQAAAVVTVSEDLRARLLSMGVAPERVHTLRNGVDLARFRPAPDRAALRRRLGYTRPTLLSVGNLVELKGHHLVIEALPALENVDLVIAGDGDMRGQLERLAHEHEVASRVRFVGRLPQAELVAHYGAADALVLASSREGWANVLLESMACGTPVIASAVGGNPEVVRSPEAGVLVRDREPGALAAACRTLLAGAPPRAETRRYAEGFSWDAVCDGLVRLFEAAAPRTGPLGGRTGEMRLEEGMCGTSR